MSRVEALARAACEADGLDPDEIVMGGPNAFALKAVDFNGFAMLNYEPRWLMYQRGVYQFLTMLEANAAFNRESDVFE